MTESEKLNEFRKAWMEAGISAGDFKEAAGFLGKSPEQYALELFDETLLLERSLSEHIKEVVAEKLLELEAQKELEDYENKLLIASGLSPATRWTIRKLPHGQWEEAIEKALRRSKHVKLTMSIVNSREANRLFLSENDGLGFLPMVVFSILCKAYAEGHESITLKELWQTTHGNRHFDKDCDYDSFAEEVVEAVHSLNNHFAATEGRDWIYMVDIGRIVIRCNPRLWNDAVKKRHICDINGMLGGSSHLPWLQKAYIARWVSIAANENNAMPPVMTFERLKRDTGTFSKNKVAGYLRWLECNGLIAKPFFMKGLFRWNNVRKTDRKARKEG